MDITLTINGKEYVVESSTISLRLTLNAYIRQHAKLTGTKYMCLEGGCGACVVSVTRVHPLTQDIETFAINSCLKSLYACDGYEVTTIEALGNRHHGYHPLQTSLTRLHGSQCGFCTGGMIMNMYALLEQRQADGEGRLTMADIERSFGGNMCRCTGYRPILEAFRSFGCDASVEQRRKCHGSGDVPDIEDFVRVCPSRTVRQRRGLARTVHQLDASNRPIVWHQVATLPDLFSVFERIDEEEPYQLVVGNTARGITRPTDALRTFININDIAELHTITASDESFTIGASVTLTEAIKTLHQAAATMPGFEYCAQLAEHYERVANLPVRNVGSLAGNLCYKQQHPEFASDVFLTLDTVDARLTICDRTDARTTVTMQQFLALNMRKRVLYNIQLLPIDAACTALRTYKIMIRAQNAHAYVNAGFNVRFAGSQVLAARICYGGIAPDFTHASRTEDTLLACSDLYTDEALQQALASLDAELQCDWVLPDAQPVYRKQLAMSMFYRFVLSTCRPAGRVSRRNLSGAEPQIERPLSVGTQDYQTVRPNYPLTEPVPKYEGILQASGEALYVNDMPAQPGELFAVFVVATRVHCRIVRIDGSSALASRGVQFFYAAKDIPGKNSFTPKTILTPHEEQIFLDIDDIVQFNGQPVGVLLADTQQLAEEASELVEIMYVETTDHSFYSLSRLLFNQNRLKPIRPTINDIDLGPLLHDSNTVTSDTQSDATVSGRFATAGQYHFHMETHTCIAWPHAERARSVRIHSSTQWADLTQRAIAGALGIAQNQVHMEVTRLGGSFGAKITRAPLIACAAALGAFLSHRPVRFRMGLQANMRTIGGRAALIGDYRVSVAPSTGRIQTCECRFVQDAGCSLNDAPAQLTALSFANCYDASAWKIDGQMVLTDAASSTYCRAPGTLEGIAMAEYMMEHIAVQLRLDPMQVRLNNMRPDHPMRPMIGVFMGAVEFDSRRAECDAFNAAHRWRKRGIAAVPMSWQLRYFGLFPAYVAIYHGDGSVVVAHGGIECGQGINTKVAQTVAYALHVPLASIEVRPMDTVTSANAMMTGASCTSETACYAAKRACDELLARMQPMRAAMKAGYTWAELVGACYEKQIDLRATYQFKESDVANYDIYGMCACEAEVDVLTGNVLLRRVDLWEDVGESLSPLVDVGQVEGAFVMGIGYWLTEQLVYDRNDGRLLTDRTWTYKVPGALDIPVDFRIRFISNSPNPRAGVLRSKATGEPAICMSVVILFALRYAIDAARRESGITDPWFALGSATTPEQVFLKCVNEAQSYTI